MLIGTLLIGLPISALISAAIYFPFFLILQKTKTSYIRHFTNYLLIGCLSIIFFATLFLEGIRFNPEYHFLNLTPFIWLTNTYSMGQKRMIQQLIMNIIMFIPLGILIPMVFSNFRKLWKTTLLAFLITLFIETLQYFTGRSADIDDIIMNLVGGINGYFIFFCLNHLFETKLWWRKANQG